MWHPAIFCSIVQNNIKYSVPSCGNQTPSKQHILPHFVTPSTALPWTHCIALPCTALQGIALPCTVLYCTAPPCPSLHAQPCTALHRMALYCTSLHCTAMHGIALPCTVLYCTVLLCPAMPFTARPTLHCSALHYPAPHCTALHCIALPSPIAASLFLQSLWMMTSSTEGPTALRNWGTSYLI